MKELMRKIIESSKEDAIKNAGKSEKQIHREIHEYLVKHAGPAYDLDPTPEEEYYNEHGKWPTNE